MGQRGLVAWRCARQRSHSALSQVGRIEMDDRLAFNQPLRPTQPGQPGVMIPGIVTERRGEFYETVDLVI